MLRTDTSFSYGTSASRMHCAHCRVRIFRLDGRHVVILSEVADNKGLSITNAIEEIATDLAFLYSLDPVTTTWLEHYDDRSFRGRARNKEMWTAVTFSWIDGKASDPCWRSVYTPEVARLLGSHVGDLV